MGRRIQLCVLLVVLAALRSAAAEPWVLGYWVGYQAELMPVDEIPWDALTHIAVGPMVPRRNGRVDASMYRDPDTAREWARQIAAAAVAHGVTPILMVGGGGVEKQFFTAADKHRRVLVKSLLTLARDLGFHGFDLDYEGDFERPANQRMFKRLVAALRRTSPDAVLTFPAISVTTTLPQDKAVAFYARIAGQLDHVFLQTYAMSGPYEGWLSWHSSPLTGADGPEACGAGPCRPVAVDFDVERFLAAGVPPAKLGLGVGFFGTCWNGVTGPNQPVDGVTVADEELSYADVVGVYAPAMTAQYDDGAQAAYLSSVTPVGTPACTFVSYESAASIQAKAAYARAKGLDGTIVWTINEGHRAPDFADADGLLRMTAAAFR